MRYAGYLDHNATTPIRPEALHAATAMLAMTGNPSSVHRFGRDVRKGVEDAREQVAALVGAVPASVIFTSGGTEANGLAVRGSGRRRVLVSAVEHASVLEATPRVEVVPVDDDGVIDLAALDTLLRAGSTPALVSVMLANNETGVIEPVQAVAALARRHGALVHCDAVQAAGRIRVPMADLGAHLLTLSAHKIGGPAGSGALIVAPEVDVAAEMVGGGQERRRRAGTENLAGIAGFGAAAEAAAGDMANAVDIARLRDDLERRLVAVCPEARPFGGQVPRLPNTSCLPMPAVRSEVQVMAFDLAGVAVSAGAACSSGKVGRSHVLEAMGVAADEAETGVRVSLGWTTTAADVDRFVECWSALYRRSAADRATATAA